MGENLRRISILPRFIRLRLAEREGLARVVGNTGWLLADKLFRMGVGIFVNGWVARHLGPDGFGLLNYAAAFAALFSALSTLGLDSIVVRELVRDPSDEREIVGTTWILRTAGGIGAFFLAVAASMVTAPGDPLTTLLVGITASGMIVQSFDVIEQWFQSRLESRYGVYARNAAFLFSSAGKVILILAGAPLVAFALMGTVEIVVAAIGLVVLRRVRGGGGSLLPCWSSSRARALLRDSWPLIFSGLVTMVYLRIDQIMIRRLSGDGELGIYSAAVKIAEVFYFIPMAIHASVTPRIVEAREAGDDQFYGVLQKVYNLMAFVGYAIGIPLSLAGGGIMSVVYGSAYQRGGVMLSLLAWSLLFVSMGVARSLFLTTMNWTRLHLMTVALGAFVNVLLNLSLIPRWGGVGASIATLLSYWVAAHLSCYLHPLLCRTGSMLTASLLRPRFW